MKRNKIGAFALCLLAGLCAVSARATDYYLATTGSDSNDGLSEATAFKTLTFALTKATADGDILHVGEGTFTIGDTKQVTQSTITVSTGLTIEGADTDKTTIFTQSGTLSGAANAFTVSHDDAVVRNLTLMENGSGSAIKLTAGTVTDCIIRDSVAGTSQSRSAIDQTGGLIVNCKIYGCKSNSQGSSLNLNEAPSWFSGNATVRNCLFYSNTRGGEGGTWTTGGAGGVTIRSTSAGTVTFENCTIAGNNGVGRTGGVEIYGNSVTAGNVGNVIFRNCVIAGNLTRHDPKLYADYASRDLYLKKGTGAVTFENCLIGEMPVDLAGVTLTDCVSGAAGFADERNKDYSLVLGSSAYGWGYNAGSTPTSFACAIETPTVDRANGSLALTLQAKHFNAPGTVTYAWDLDGDGTYETSGGATVAHTFTTPGWNKVGLQATSGGQSVTYAAANFAYVAPSPILVRKSGSTPTFPYATEATAASSVSAALDAAIDGSKISVATGTGYAGFTAVNAVEIYGAGRDSVVFSGSATTYDRAFVHDLAFNAAVYVQKGLQGVLSNVTVRGVSGATAITMQSGDVAYCSVSNCASKTTTSGILSYSGNVRNCLVYGCKATSTGGPAVYMGGGTIESTTIAHNVNTGTGTQGGLYLAGATTVRNTIMYGNKAGSLDESAEANNFAQAKSTCLNSDSSNNCAPFAVGENPVTTDPIVSADGSITAASSCYNAGSNETWMAGAKDIAGNDRIRGVRVDIGAYEAEVKIALAFTMDKTTGVGSQDVTFTVVGDGKETIASYEWDFDGDGVYEFITTLTEFTRNFPEGRYSNISMRPLGVDPYTSSETLDFKTMHAYVVPSPTAASKYPYNSWATAAGSISDALSGLGGDGAVVTLTNGTYTAGYNSISSGIRIEGLGGRDEVVLDRNNGDGCLVINHVDAVVEGVTIQSARANGLTIGANGGTMRNCRVKSCYGSTHVGVAISASAGLVENVDVVGFSTSMTGPQGEGTAVRLLGSSVMRNSLIRQETEKAGGFSAVYVAAGARLENCVIYGSSTVGPAVNNAGAVVNCVMWGNTCTETTATQPGAPDWEVAGSGVFSNCVSTISAGTAAGNVVGDPLFTDPTAGDFSFDVLSPCFDNGQDLPWTLLEDAKDFYGNPRIKGASVDVGPYENPATSLKVAIDLSSHVGIGQTNITMTARAIGFTFASSASFSWTIENSTSGESVGLTGNPVQHIFETGVYDISLRVTNADSKGRTYETELEGAITVYAPTVYVAVSGSSPEWPYDTPAKAAKTVQDILDAGLVTDGITVRFLAGTHAVPAMAVKTRTAFVGSGAAATILENSGGTVFSLQNPLCGVSNLTIRASLNPMVSITAQGGTVEGVNLTAVSENASVVGAALRMEGGTARRCRIYGNTCSNKSQCPVYVYGADAILEDCLIDGNRSEATASSDHKAGGVHLTRGTVRNCTIVNNVSLNGTGGLAFTPDAIALSAKNKIINTIAWGNTGSTENEANWSAESSNWSLFYNNYTQPVIGGGTDNIGGTEDPGFLDFAAGDYRLTGRNAAVYNKGLYQDWMATALDLLGSKRSKNAALGQVDIGCYESLMVTPGILTIFR